MTEKAEKAETNESPIIQDYEIENAIRISKTSFSENPEEPNMF